ncbi:MAG: polyamine aminopropyltransferase [SAR202 cluster bacterium]|nr:polyamine aminopropyltransferase [SAR202 cluster bacterium]
MSFKREFPTYSPDGKWYYEYITPDFMMVLRVKNKVFEGQSKFQQVIVHDTAAFGRTLVLDGKTQSSESDEYVYHEALVQPCLIAHPNPKKVFVAGGGEGSTIREALAHKGVEKVVMADIDDLAVEMCKKNLPNHHRGSFDDPRLELVIGDALAYLEQTKERFDVAIIDIPDPLEEGPAYLLFTQEFYRLVKSRLTPNGMVVAQSGPTGPIVNQTCFSVVFNTMKTVFPNVVGYEAFVQAFCGSWGFISASVGNDLLKITPQEVDKRIAERLGPDKLKFYDGITHTGMFGLPKYLRKSVADEKRVITKDKPLYVV